ncbi:hypothetical protein PtA15_11A574 [Puccinia triticina]|uniref:Uncharacterized protein n=1 Tax=Puccinia triticina TaxID=208348 RepID=A0ABY7D0V3_9BASI|nr:uncharacterized protein PtA15_11A574 [Puccinia triticina]WAQ89882.1 hypothetical protein PtA15_11A574 [Puccinia triticina]
MNISLLLFLLALSKVHWILAGSSKVLINLDPSNSLNEAVEGQRQSIMGGTHPQTSSPLLLFPTSTSSQLEESGNVPPSEHPQIAPPEVLSRSSRALSDDSIAGRKRLSIWQLVSQGEEDSNFPQHVSKKLASDLGLSLGPFGQRESQLSLSSSEYTSEKQQDNVAVPSHFAQREPQLSLGPSEHTSGKQQEDNALANTIHIIFAQVDVPNKLQEVDSMMENKGQKSPGEDRYGNLTESSPMNTEKAVREYELEGVNAAFWAWVWVIWEHVGQSATSEVETYLKPHMADLKSWFFPKDKSYPNPQTEKMGENSGSDCQNNQINIFASFLWAVHIRVLEILVVQQPSLAQEPNRITNPSKYYWEEQSGLITWFFLFMKLFNNPEAITSLNDPESYESLIVKKGRVVCEKVLKAIHSKPGSENCYQTFFPAYSRKYLFSLEGDLLISDAVVHLIGFYYKNTNFKKWNYAFKGQDMDLVVKLEDLGTA